MTSNVVAWIRANEEARSNRAREAETHRANLVLEQHNRNVLQEQSRANRANEAEAQRSNRARESESRRSAMAQERLSSDRNVLQSRQNTISLQRMLTDASTTRRGQDIQRQTAGEQVAAQRWRNQQDILLGQRRLTNEYSLTQQQIESQERLESREITQRAEQAWLNYQLGQDQINAQYNLKLLETGAKFLDKYGATAFKKAWNAATMLGY